MVGRTFGDQAASLAGPIGPLGPVELATKHDESEKEEELARSILGGMFVEDCGKQRGGARLFSAEVIFFLLSS